MKKLRKILLFLLVIPMSIALSSCGKKSQPSDDNGGSGGGGSPIASEKFSVAYDFNLPEKYAFLVSDFTDANNDVNSNVELATISDANLAKYFLGWCKEGEDEVILDSTITSSTATTINLRGKWNEQDIEKYYYTPGLTFEVDVNKAVLTSSDVSSKKVVIPQYFIENSVDYDVATIADNVFENSGVENFVINADVLSIGNECFKNSDLKSFDFSKVELIGNSSFEGTKLVDVTFSKSLNSVGSSAFKECNDLSFVDFNESAIDVSNSMFYGCDDLEIVINAKNITKLGTTCFAECVSLKNTDFLSVCVDLDYIYDNAFLNCTGLSSAFVPECVLNIYRPFMGCARLETLTIAKTFDISTNISDNLLDHVGNIGLSVKTINLIGSTVEKLGMDYFEGLDNLETFVMSDSVKYIEKDTFRNNPNLKNVTLSKNIVLESFTYEAFNNTKFLNERTEPLIYDNDDVKTIIYVPETIASEYEIPEGVAVINNSAFEGRKSLQKIIISSSVTAIGESAFEDCTSLREVEFAENSNITKLGDFVFSGCTSLSVIDLTKLTALVELGERAFSGVNISNFILPSTVDRLGIGVFEDAEIAEFSVSDGESDFFVIDGVLYKDISVSDSETKHMLYAYPKLKVGDVFICPANVSKIANYAFAYSSNLNIYFSQTAMEWESSENALGQIQTHAFYETNNVKVLREYESFVTNETDEVKVYTFANIGVNYNYETDKIELTKEFSSVNKYCFAKVLKEEGLDAYFEIIIFLADVTNPEQPKVTAQFSSGIILR